MIVIKKGLDLPITGNPEQKISDGKPVSTVALIGTEYNGMKPTMKVEIGDKVKLGQVLFADKKNPDALFTSPGSGTVIQVNRGHMRCLNSVVIELEGTEETEFESFPAGDIDRLPKEKIANNLVQSGLWTALRTRPYSKIPHTETTPNSIFITAMDSNPMAADAAVVLSQYPDAFANGVKILSRLTNGTTYVCKAAGASIPPVSGKSIVVEEFKGAHPAGLAGTHIHFLDPVSDNKTVWSINYQDVIAVGHLFATGRLMTERTISLAGPQVKNPRLIKTRLGANVAQLVAGELAAGDNRVISGSVLIGTTAEGDFSFLGRYHQQISVILEGRNREFLGWMAPGSENFSVKNVFLSKLFPRKRFSFNSATNGSQRAIVPIGMYEKVMPLDIQPIFLLRSLSVYDTDHAQALGCLELDEEDLGLCTFVCPGKNNYGPILRENLTKIEKDG